MQNHEIYVNGKKSYCKLRVQVEIQQMLDLQFQA